MSEREDIVFSRNTVEFVTVAAEYCAYVERCNEHTAKEFIGTLLKLLPLLYLKAQMLPEGERVGDDELEDFVTEDSYEVLRMNIYELLADKDSYLDVFVSEMKYSDTPVTKSISEDLADIYQDVKNFVCLFQHFNIKIHVVSQYFLFQAFKVMSVANHIFTSIRWSH